MTLLLIAFAVAMDATAVCAAYGLRRATRAQLAVLSLTFGLFQCAMAWIGAVGGTALLSRIEAWDHWLAFSLLLLVGGRMIWEALRADERDPEPASIGAGQLLILGVATSIDSLAVGLTLPTIGVPVAAASIAIGLVTLVLSFAGGVFARRLGGRFGPRIEIAGGLILIAIGIRTLGAHLG